MDEEVKAIVASLTPPLADGKVGFFWVVSDRSGRDKLPTSGESRKSFHRKGRKAAGPQGGEGGGERPQGPQGR